MTSLSTTEYSLTIPIMGINIPNMGIKKIVFDSTVLFSKVQQHILKLLYLNPDTDFNTNEIIRIAKSGTGAVQRELEKLTITEIIKIKQLGNQKRYYANKDLPYYSELRSIIIKTFGLAVVLGEELKKDPLEKQIKIAFIYGSFPKQTDTASSDIDLMLIGDALTYADIFQVLKHAESTLGRKINPTFYSQKEWLKKFKEGNNFINQIIKQPKIFLIGKEDDLEKLR